MPVDERNRLQLAEAAKRVLGADEGITLMELLPPVGWADVASRHDLLALEQRIDSKFEAMDARMDARFAQVDARFAQVDGRFGAVDARFDALDARFDARFDASDYKVLGTMERELRKLTWRLFAIYGASMGALIGALVAVTKL